MTPAEDRNPDTRLQVRVVPRAARNAVVEMDDGTWKIRLHAPPVEGKANRELRKFLAATLGIRPRAVTLTAGESSRTKVVAILGLSLRQVLDRLRTASETQTRG